MAAPEECTARFPSIVAQGGCVHADRLRSKPYGMDPVFHPGRSLFNARIVPKLEDFYNTTEGSGQVIPSSVALRERPLATPHEVGVWTRDIVSIDGSVGEPRSVC